MMGRFLPATILTFKMQGIVYGGVGVYVKEGYLFNVCAWMDRLKAQRQKTRRIKWRRGSRALADIRYQVSGGVRNQGMKESLQPTQKNAV